MTTRELGFDFSNFSTRMGEYGGVRSYGKEVMESINWQGVLEMNGTKVIGITQVNGTFEAKDASLGDLEINGQVELKETIVIGKSIINGVLNAKRCTFEKQISIDSQYLELIETNTHDILIRYSVNRNAKEQEVVLKDKTLINGNIIFESGHGKVFLQNGSIINGKVEGGEIIKTV